MADIRIVPAQGAINVTGSADFKGTGGSTILYLTGSGQIGAGTTSPDSEFHIVGSGTRFVTLDRSGTRSYDLGVNSSGTFLVTDNTAAADRISLSVSGSVGIGTTNPSQLLHLVNASGPVIRLVRSSNRFDLEADTNSAGIVSRDSATANFSITGFGNVGIGTASPSYKLQVDGQLAVKGSESDLWMINTGGGAGTWRILGSTGNTTKRFRIYDHDNSADRFNIETNGQIKFNTYGAGTFTGTAAYNLSVDSSGNIIETANPSLTGTGTANYVTKWSGGNSLTNSLIYDTGTAIGIGTTSPSTFFHVSTASTEIARFQGDTGGVNSVFRIQIGSVSDSFASGSRTFLGDGGTDIVIGTANSSYTPNNSYISLNHGGSIYMGAGSSPGLDFTLTTDGSVGIGTSSPDSLLHIYGSGNTFTRYTNTANTGQYIDIGTNSAGESFVYGYGAYPLLFGTNGTERARITPSGSIGIGTTNPAYTLTVGKQVASDNADYAIAVLRHGTGAAPGSWTSQPAILINDQTDGGPASVDTTGLFSIQLGRFDYTDTNAANASLVNITYDGTLGPFRVDGKGNTWIGYNRSSVPTNSGAFGLLVYGGASIGSNYQATTPPSNGAIIEGSVGIGITSLNQKLVVAGNIAVSASNTEGSIWFGDGQSIGLYRNNTYDLVLSQEASSGNPLYLAGAGDVIVSIDSNNNETGRKFIVGSNSVKASNELFSVNESGNVYIGNDLTVTGKITAREFHTTFVSASIIYQSGSTKFGDSSDDIHHFTGCIGIGTTSPASLLHVYSTNGAPQGITVTGGDESFIKFLQGAGGVKNWGLITTNLGASDFGIYQSSANGGDPFSAGTPRLYFNANGYVGIGTTTVNKLLVVAGDAWINRPTNKVDNNGATEFGARVEFNNSFATNESGYMVFRYPTYNNFLIGGDYDGNIGGAIPNIQFGRSSGTVYMHIASSDGNVGIGTTGPLHKLHVSGSIISGHPTTLYNSQVSASGYAASFYPNTSYPQQSINMMSFQGNWADGNAGIDTHFGIGFQYENYLRGGISYDHRGIERMNIWSSYGSIMMYTPDGVKTDTDPYVATQTPRLTVAIGGNVGVGTTSPAAKLHAVGTNGAIQVGGSGYTLHPSGMQLGQYVTGMGYIQAPSGGRVEIWNGGTENIVNFNNDKSSEFFGSITAPSFTGDIYTNSIYKKTNGSPIVINAGLNASRALRVYYDMDVYNTVVFTDASWNSQGSIAGSSGVMYYSANTRHQFNGKSIALTGDTNYLVSGSGGGYPTFYGNSSSAQIGFGRTGNSEGTSYLGSDAAYLFRLWDASFGQGYLNVQRSDGNIGVGVTNPLYKLDVDGDTKAKGFVVAGGGGYTSGSIFSDSNWGMIFRARQTSPVSAQFMWANSADSELMRIDNAGSLGVGTSGPYAGTNVRSVTINATAYPALALQVGGVRKAELFGFSDHVSLYTPGFITLDPGDTEAVRILAGGNVGIGTTSPAARLHISGSILAGDITGAQTGNNITIYHGGGNLADGTIRSYFELTNPSAPYVNVPDAWNWKIATVARPGTSGNYNSQLEILRTTRSGVTDSSTMVFKRDGNVGIGTTNPRSLLEVSGSITLKEALIFDTSAAGTTNNARISFGSVPSYAGSLNTSLNNFAGYGVDNYGIILESGYNPGDMGGIKISDDGVIIFGASDESLFKVIDEDGNTEHFTIWTSGEVGIGSTAPGYKLDVSGTTRGTSFYAVNDRNQFARGFFRLTSATNNTSTLDIDVSDTVTSIYSNYYGGGADQPIRIGTYANLTNQLYLATSGNVGIGTTSPSHRLHVTTGVKANSVYIGMSDNFTTRSGDGDNLYIKHPLKTSGGWWGINVELSGPVSGHTAAFYPFRYLSDENSDGSGDTTWSFIDKNGGAYFAGNVGIGTDSPSGKLSVRADGFSNLISIGGTVTDNIGYLSFWSNSSPGQQLVVGGLQGIRFQTGAHSSASEIVRFASNGNVGIGTDSPESRLNVRETGITAAAISSGWPSYQADLAAQSKKLLYLAAGGNNSTGTAGTGPSVVVELGEYYDARGIITMRGAGGASPSDQGSGYGKDLMVKAGNSDNGNGFIGGKLFLAGGSGYNSGYGTNYGAISMQPEGGNVGIGKTNPDRRLDVTKTYSNTETVADFTNSNTAKPAQSGYDTVRIIQQDVPTLRIQEWDGTNDQDLAIGVGDGNANITTTQPLRIFSGCGIRSNNYSGGGGNLGVYIATTGNVGIRSTTTSYQLDVAGTIRATGDVIAYSDARVKENVLTLENSLELVKKLRGVSYNKIGESEKKVGVIAQEVLEVLPEVVSQDQEGTYSVAYGNITAVLIEAIKQQQLQIDELKAEIKQLKG